MAKITHRRPRKWDSWPLLGAIERAKYKREFASDRAAGMFSGVYPTAESALAAAPRSLPVGYNNAESARLYTDRLTKLYPSDYAAIYWLAHLFQQGEQSVLDVGGHVGVAFHAFQRVLSFPAELSWQVFDVPAVVARGRQRPVEAGSRGRLEFTDRIEDGDGRSILFASGALQYLAGSLAETLSLFKSPPRYILVNHLPVHQTETYFTLQCIGTAYCPYRIVSRTDALKGLARLGYRLADAWQNAEKSCVIPFHTERSLDCYRGFLLERKSDAAPRECEEIALPDEHGALDGGR